MINEVNMFQFGAKKFIYIVSQSVIVFNLKYYFDRTSDFQ